jgi:hypothetical protein
MDQNYEFLTKIFFGLKIVIYAILYQNWLIYHFISKLVLKNNKIWWKLIDFKQEQHKRLFLNKKNFWPKIHSFGP